jgi:hypothetical protein
MALAWLGAAANTSAQADTSPPTCKAFNGKCCDPAIAAHLPKEAVFSSCGRSEAQFLGEQAAKDTCKYFFKIPNEKEDITFVQVYAPKQKEPGTEPTDPFFDWTRVGKAFVTKKAKTPKAAPMLQNMTGIWYPGNDYVVNINASVKVCSKAQALKLAAKVK